jgi:hypothetical protein
VARRMGIKPQEVNRIVIATMLGMLARPDQRRKRPAEKLA